MLNDYLDELHAIQQIPLMSVEEKTVFFIDATESGCTTWIDIENEAGAAIGFLIVAQSPNCHPMADYYIQEAYILPEYRGKRHMSRAVERFVQNHDGVYCLFVLTKNTYAYGFWHKLFDRIGYHPCDLADVGAADEQCRQYGFAPNGKSE